MKKPCQRGRRRSISEDETDKAFVNSSEDDNDDVSVSDNTRDEHELLYAYILQYGESAQAQNYLFIYSSIFCSSK
jgi:hypothetical protein